eukprot:524638-Pleurochrysis_carterae.AAC.1
MHPHGVSSRQMQRNRLKGQKQPRGESERRNALHTMHRRSTRTFEHRFRCIVSQGRRITQSSRLARVSTKQGKGVQEPVRNGDRSGRKRMSRKGRMRLERRRSRVRKENGVEGKEEAREAGSGGRQGGR